jgi:hypothetical protein
VKPSGRRAWKTQPAVHAVFALDARQGDGVDLEIAPVAAAHGLAHGRGQVVAQLGAEDMQQMDRTSEQTGIQDLMARSLICLGNGCHVVVMSVLRWQNKLYGSPEIKYSIILALPMKAGKRLRIVSHAA